MNAILISKHHPDIAAEGDMEDETRHTLSPHGLVSDLQFDLIPHNAASLTQYSSHVV